jgi:hypothetical protein
MAKFFGSFLKPNNLKKKKKKKPKAKQKNCRARGPRSKKTPTPPKKTIGLKAQRTRQKDLTSLPWLFLHA